jgi:two-component system, NarL family, response regulator DegU
MESPDIRKIKLVIAEDQDLMRRSFIALLKEDPQFDVVGEAAHGKELIEVLKETEADIVLLDIEMPVMNGMDALEIVGRRFPEVKVIILTMHGGTVFISEMMARGARAFINKSCDAESLFEAIHTVDTDGYFFDKSVSEALLKGLQRERSINPIFGELALSEREIDVLREICEGKTNKQISDRLKVSPSTIDFHKSNIYKKTKSRSILDLLKYAIKNGIININ